MRKLLFLGCNVLQVPYLRAARTLGFQVVGCDRNANAPGAQLCDAFHNAGYDQPEVLLKIARRAGFGPDDRIFTASAHHAYAAASRVAQGVGIDFPSPEAIDTCLDKTRFYTHLMEQDVPIPPTLVYREGCQPKLVPGRVYYLKSDYGKSPRYCYRIADGRIPELPKHFDAFYRRGFVLQPEIVGVHYRLNLYGSQLAVFRRQEDGMWTSRADLGARQAEVLEGLQRTVRSLGLEAMLTKWDLIETRAGWFILDIGLDPPLRIRLLSQHHGIDFETAYTRAYLLRDPTLLPRWSDLYGSYRISGSAESGYQVGSLGIST